ncbi:hypothetical protein KP509_34G038500 [Ceratopteris richardii]|uniref:C2 domain-containing protein n=1 Tax=Ceratopteris richardii TaxID=49495 RepID=A0A8T2QKA8_CERRI|nr:hypothetical protein KP509_34G038500 [Ceratopteris richardii]KAH7284076.1 hypothetical protein KP509_34G038500 [Ceratopteris richardii]KAH7284077.1 hypothetical protein KP509_34G038500 [Ceratopteris richardii]KAH7284078.1 hypothetical protein KP509_34G038500 [Ceratopteris richardii]
MDAKDGVWATVAQLIEQLRTSTTGPQQKEFHLQNLLDLISNNADAKTAVSCHPQAIPVLVTILRSSSSTNRNLTAMIIEILSSDEETKTKILLGGSVPALLALLKSGPQELQFTAARVLYALSKANNEDKVGPKIFTTEGIVQYLWELLKTTRKIARPLDGVLTGTLRNLSKDAHGFWEVAAEAEALDILLKLILSGSPEAQAHCCHLLSDLILVERVTCNKMLQSGCVDQLLQLLSPGNDLSVRAEAAGVLKSLSQVNEESKDAIINSNGISALIRATVAPCKEGMSGAVAQSLQENAMGALANISGGLHSIIKSLAESLEVRKSEHHISDTLGALASALMVLDEKDMAAASSVEVHNMEDTLIRQIKVHGQGLIQERSIEALASLYGNKYLDKIIPYSEVKKLLVNLITMTSGEVQTELLKSLLMLTSRNTDVWHAFQQRQGIQLLISLLGVCTEEEQDCAVALLSLISQENEDSNWAITAAGGIPPLVQILEVGSMNAKEDSATILENLCTHSEDIRSCVEKAGAVPALLWLLKNANKRGQEIAARTLKHLVSKSDAIIISQLNAMLVGETPESKFYISDTLGHLLSVCPLADILIEGSPTNEAYQALIKMLASFKEDVQEQAASAFAKLLQARKDLCQNPMIADIMAPLHKILLIKNERIAMHAVQCLAALFDSMDKNTLVAEAAPTTIAPIFRLCSSDNIEVIEQAISALANLFAEKDLSTKLKFGDLINPVTRVLREGTNLHAKAQAAKAIYRHLEVHMIDDALAERLCQSGTIIALVSLLSITDNDANVKHQVLEALMSLTRSIRVDHPLWSILFQVCHTITPIIDCLAIEKPLIQDKAVQVLSKFCKYHQTALGEEITTTSKCIAALANRVIASPSLEVQIGAASLLICAAKEHRQQTMCVITEINCLLELIQALMGMLSTEASLSDEIHWANVDKDNGPHVGRQSNKLIDTDDLSEERKIVSLWLLSIIASCDYDIRCVITEAGAIDAIIRELGCYTSLKKKNQEENGGMWVGVLLLSILFQDKDVLRLPAVNRTIPILATLLQSDDTAARYFSGQAITNLLLTGDRSTILAVANSGAPVGLVHLLGNFDADTTNFQDLVQEFSLVPNPAQTALEYLFRTNDIKMGSTARKVIPALIELMTPNAERPSAPLFAEGLLTLLATGSDTNKVLMADAGAVEALTRYLSLGPKDNMEECTADLMRILFSTRELKCHPSALGALEQLIAVLRLGSKNSRYSAARALQELFEADHIKNHDNARQVIPPLMEMLRTGSEKEQKVSLKTLANLSYDNQPKAMLIADPDSKCLEFLCKILWSDCSLELKEEAAGLCFTLFAFSRIRAYPAAVACIEPLILLAGDRAAKSIWLPILHALNHLLDNTSLIETALDHGAVCMLVDMLRTNDHLLPDVSLPSLVKLARQSDHCRAEMEEYGVMEIIFRLFPSLSDYSSASAAELLQLLTTAGRVLEIPASTAVELLLSVLSRPGLSTAGQYNIMHVLLTIIGGSQQLVNYKLSPNQPIQNLILLLDSPSQQVQQLASELFSHLLVERKLDENVITKKVVLALVQLTVQGMHKAVFALETASTVLPQEVAEAGGIQELSKVIMQLDPLPPHELWESASAAICNILQYGPIFFWHVPPEAFVRMLHSENESTVVISLQGMLTLQKENVAYADAFAKCGAIDALMELLSCHRCEEATAQVLETLLNDSTVRSMKTTYRIVAPLANYLLDPETQNRGAQILSALALGDLFQRPVFSSPSSDVVLGCKALMSILQGHSHEDVKTVALRALQNLLANGRANRQALSEAGAIDLVCGLLCSRDRDTAAQAATLAKFLCCGQSVEENASIEVVKALSVALQNALHEGLSVNDDILRAIAVIFTNFPKLCTAEPATLCIPLLIQAMKEGSDASRDAGLDIFSLMRQTWTASPKEVVKAQTVAMADVIPILQSLIKAGTTKFHERATTLLLSLPGSLSVKIKQGKNLKQGMGSTNAYCKLTLGNSPPKETKVVSNNVNPEWGQVFAWPFERAPRGQKVHIDCRNKSTFSKKSMGKLTIQVDRVIALGTVTGNYTLQSEKNKDGTPRVLEIEISWSSG